MNKAYNLLLVVLLGFLLSKNSTSQAQLSLPNGFFVEDFATGISQMTDMEFDEDGFLYVSQKSGTIVLVDTLGNQVSTLLDISDEVGNWGDHGLLGIALDPEYYTNGYIYLLYCVDRHHLLFAGTADYDANIDTYEDAAIGRLTRYTVTNPSNHATATINENSRHVLIGETINTGIPILFSTHGIGSLEFGTDGTLLVSTGDGAGTANDVGGPVNGSHSQQALVDGIITNAEDIGVFRPQSLSSLCGKILRVDKATGDGLPSNPFYDPLDPRANRSRVWVLGLRNPFSITVIPNTGSHYPADGQPGTIIAGDVGAFDWEEMNIITQPGQNFGWPMYEGMEAYNLSTTAVENLDAPTSGGCSQDYYYFAQLLSDYDGVTTPAWPDPCNPSQNINSSTNNLFTHRRPAFDWEHNGGKARASIDGQYWDMTDGTNPVPGPDFSGECSIGGSWITGYGFPAAYQNRYYHGEWGNKWIKIVDFELNWDPKEIEDFLQYAGGGNDYRIIKIKEHSHYDGFFIMDYPNAIRRIRYDASGNQPPQAVIVQDTSYTPNNSLTVQFDGTNSTDTETAPLAYLWDFGDGTTSTNATETHVFTGTGVQEKIDITLTVTDTGGLSSVVTSAVFLNNTPPSIDSTSIDTLNYYPLYTTLHPDLYASVTDNESPLADLTFTWQQILFHEDHNHPEPFINQDTTTVPLVPVGCDGQLYYWQINLTVTDPGGLTDHYQKDIYPPCGVPVANQDIGSYIQGEDEYVDVVTNDLILDGVDLSSVTITQQPSHGTASVGADGRIYYDHDGTNTSVDTLYYTVADVDGDLSNEIFVELVEVNPPTVTMQNPLDGGVNEGSNVRFEYSITGKDDKVAQVMFQIDGVKTYVDSGLLGFFNIDSLDEGPHSVITYLLDSTGTPLAYGSAQTTINFDVSCVGSMGFMLREHFGNIPGATIADLTGAASYPDNPTSSGYMPKFTGTNQIGNDYGTRIRGYFHPLTTGDYAFRVSGDEVAEFYLSSDSTDNPDSLTLIANVPGPTGKSEFDKYPEQLSAPITLEAGKKYYFDFLHKEDRFSDYYQVQWGQWIGASTSFTNISGVVVSPYVICTGSSDVGFPTPVEFLSFDATAMGRSVALDWATGFEQNNSHFILERAGADQQFQAIGQIPSQGDSETPQQYEVRDDSPLDGINYYKLRQVDLDGTTSFSNIVQVSVDASAPISFPNPATNQAYLTVNIDLENGTSGLLELFDVLGQRVYSKEFESIQGGIEELIPVQTLTPGTYIMTLNAGQTHYAEQVIIQQE